MRIQGRLSEAYWGGSPPNLLDAGRLLEKFVAPRPMKPKRI
jgi:hypothetical protein